MSVADGYWASATPRERRALLDDAAGRVAGTATFESNVHTVVLDFDVGDGLTLLDRSPPEFRVARDGTAERVSRRDVRGSGG